MNKPRVLMVLTRPYTDSPTTGREKINAFVHASISQIAEIRTEHFRHILATRNLSALAKASLRFIRGLLTSPQPLQALLFSDRREIERVKTIVQTFKPDVVFIESERSYYLIHALCQRWPELRIICDIDDLMSRRMAEWSRHGNAISFGYMARYLPDILQKLLAGPLAGILCRYEAKTLEKIEQQLLALCEQVILLSSKEVELLRNISPAALQPKITLIPPACDPQSIKQPIEPLRFVFIGSDALLQNRLTIEYLIELWHQHALQTPLAVYGKMTRTYPNLPIGIEFMGFAESLGSVYTEQSILLSPSFVQGGVKTKILEALEFGILPVGNSVSFEGIVSVNAYPLINDEVQFVAFLRDPATHLEPFLNTGQKISEEVSKTLEVSKISHRWQACLLPTFAQN